MKNFKLKAEDVPLDLQVPLIAMGVFAVVYRIAFVFLVLAVLAMFLWMGKLTIFLVGLQGVVCIAFYWAFRKTKKYIVKELVEMLQV